MSDRQAAKDNSASYVPVAAGVRCMINQNWWFSTLLIRQFKYCPPLNKDIKCDVLIVGGGFSGVSAAAEFLQKGFSVALIDRNMVGGSSSGRSAGFLLARSYWWSPGIC
jgi:NADPH-dependent 2,4-dienoyl-CoA reductase/sulfur reductase-like enzyme